MTLVMSTGLLKCIQTNKKKTNKQIYTLWIAEDSKRLQAYIDADISLRWVNVQFCKKCCTPPDMLTLKGSIFLKKTFFSYLRKI